MNITFFRAYSCLSFLAVLSSCFLLSSHHTTHSPLIYQESSIPPTGHSYHFFNTFSHPSIFENTAAFSPELVTLPLATAGPLYPFFRPALELGFPCAAHSACFLPNTTSHPRTSTCFRLRPFNCAQNIYALEVKCYNCGKSSSYDAMIYCRKIASHSYIYVVI
jgi:hypothetical protein